MASRMTKIVMAGAQCRVKGPHIVKMGAPNICIVSGPPILSRKGIDRGIVTTEDEYKVGCALSNSATFDDLE